MTILPNKNGTAEITGNAKFTTLNIHTNQFHVILAKMHTKTFWVVKQKFMNQRNNSYKAKQKT